MKSAVTTFELQELVRFASGGTPSKSEPSNWGGDIPWLSAKDLKRFNLHDSQDHLTAQGAKGITLAPTGSILVLVRGMTLLKDLPLGVTMRSMTFNQDVKALLPSAEVRPHYLAYVLVSRKQELLRLVETAGHGTGRLDTDILKSFPVDLPSLIQQDKFIETLGVWDAAIDKTAALFDALERRKQGLMQQLLTGRRRLKGFKGKRKEYRLGQLFVDRNETNGFGLPLLSISRSDGVIPRDDSGRIDTSNEDKSAYLRIYPGDIGYNTMRMWQGVSALSSLEGIVSPAYTVCTPTELANARFMAHLFKFPRTVNLFYRHSQGLTSDTWNLKFHHFSKIKVQVPSLDEQAAIANVLDEQNAELLVLSQQLVQLKTQKRALMQKLLSGEWRLSESSVQSKPIRKKGLQPSNNVRKQLSKR